VRRRLVIVLAAMVLVAAACGDDGDDGAGGGDGAAATTEAAGGGGAGGDGATIKIFEFSFGEPITVSAGTTVTVRNDDGVGHTWTADDGSFDSGTLGPGDTFEQTFDEPGTFAFHCNIHPSMTGTLTVT
jgi:plastocyanin